LTDGIILLDKPPGQTSFQSLGELKRRLGINRVGHAGTLDRFARGLLVVLAGRMTRLCALATSLDKEYVAVVTFGRSTDTLDPEGATTAEGPVPLLDALERALPGFLGLQLQVPPAYSALHVAGKRAYEAARGGAPMHLEPRSVTIHRIDLVAYNAPHATLRVCCSKGTYIRALARDLGIKLGSCAYVSELERTRIGGFKLEDAVQADQFDAALHLLPGARFFDAAPLLGRLTVREEFAVRLANGLPLREEFFEPSEAASAARAGTFGAFSRSGALVAVVERSDTGSWRYAAVFPEEPSGCA
jgi:tRNA pseudouridine55 synthase